MQVKRFSYTENATSPLALWYIERNCSAKCEPGCLILGERTKVNPCKAFHLVSTLLTDGNTFFTSFTPVSPAAKRNFAISEMAPTKKWRQFSTTNLLPSSFSFRFSSQLSRASESISTIWRQIFDYNCQSTWWRYKRLRRWFRQSILFSIKWITALKAITNKPNKNLEKFLIYNYLLA